MGGFEFVPWGKTHRLDRDTVVTEKIDGTNACVVIGEDGKFLGAQSRRRIITPESDNYGFAAWAYRHGDKLAELLGPGYHYGEWWGNGIRRNYGMRGKKFYLFDALRWETAGVYFAEQVPGLGVVPIVSRGDNFFETIREAEQWLTENGSVVAPGYPRPEGMIVYHVPTQARFKIIFDK